MKRADNNGEGYPNPRKQSRDYFVDVSSDDNQYKWPFVLDDCEKLKEREDQLKSVKAKPVAHNQQDLRTRSTYKLPQGKQASSLRYYT